MKNSTGIVMQLDKKYAFIMTNTGEFLKVKVKKAVPNLGEVYTGEVAKEMPFFKQALTAASLAFILLSGSGAYAYYTPTAALTIDINPSIKLHVNRWDRVIKSIPLNNDGVKVLTGLNINNKSINDALDLIVDEAKKDNFINDKYIESGKAITVSINENKSNKHFDLTKFEEHAKKNNLNIKINKSDLENKESNSKNSTDNNKTDNEKIKENNSITPSSDTSNEKDKKNSSSNSSQSNSNNKGNVSKDNSQNSNNNSNSNNNNNGQNKTENKNNDHDSVKKNDDKEKNNQSENKEREKENNKSKK